MKSCFADKNIEPDTKALQGALGNTFSLWNEISDYVFGLYPAGIAKWYYSGDKYCWNFRINDKKRAIIYLLPRENFFKIAFVFGNKATDFIMNSEICESIKQELQNAKPYAEGRGIRINIEGPDLLGDIKQLIRIKVSN